MEGALVVLDVPRGQMVHSHSYDDDEGKNLGQGKYVLNFGDPFDIGAVDPR